MADITLSELDMNRLYARLQKHGLTLPSAVALEAEIRACISNTANFGDIIPTYRLPPSTTPWNRRTARREWLTSVLGLKPMHAGHIAPDPVNPNRLVKMTVVELANIPGIGPKSAPPVYEAIQLWAEHITPDSVITPCPL